MRSEKDGIGLLAKLEFFNNVVPFDNKDSAKKKHRQIYRFIKVLCDRAEVPAGRGEYILQSNVFLQFLSSILFRKATEHGRGEVDAWLCFRYCWYLSIYS